MPFEDFYKELDANMSRTVAPEPPPKRGLIADAGTHFAIGANKYAAMPIAGLTEMAGRATGIKPLEDLGKTIGDNAESWIAQKEQESPSQKFRDIAGPGDAARWAGEQLMEFAPQAVIGLATGGAGGAAGRVAAGGLVRSGLATAEGIAGKKAVQAAIANEGRALTAGELGTLAAQRAGTAGAIAATGAGSVGMETSSIYRDQKAGEKDMGRAALYGTAAGILDTAFPAWLMSKTGLTKLMPGMGKIATEAGDLKGNAALSLGQKVRDTAKIAGIGVGEETLQEGVQTVLENIGANKQVYSDEVKKAGGDFPAFLKVAASKGISAAVHPEAWNDIVESMAAGGLIGGVMGGGSAGAGHIADSFRSRKDQGQPNVDPAASPAEVPEAGEASPPSPAVASTGILDDGGTIPEFASPAPPTGTLGKALAIAGISTETAAPSMYTRFAASPFAGAPPQAAAIAGPQAAAMLGNLQPPVNEVEDARKWAREQVALGRTELMQNRGVSDEQQTAKILKAYRESQENANAATDILPSVPPQNGQGEMERPGMGMSPLPAEVQGGGSRNILSGTGGLDDEMSRVREKTGGTQEVPPVRGKSENAKIDALQKEKERLLADPRNRGIAGASTYTPEATSRLNEINGELRQIQGRVTREEEQAKTETKPVSPSLVPDPRSLDRQAHDAATSPHNDIPEPSRAQIEAGNYRKGHVTLHGLDISIENPAGSTRKGVDETGREWSTNLVHHYGYIKGTVGRDKDHVDVFVKPGIDQTTAGNKVFVVDQKNTKNGRFDEHKVMMGYATAKEARAAYLDNYDKTGPQRIMAVTETTADGFKKWLNEGNQNKPFNQGPGTREEGQVKTETTTAPGPAPQAPASSSSPVPRSSSPARNLLDHTKDSLPVAIAKLGGVSRSEVEQHAGNVRDLAAALNKIVTTESRTNRLHVITTKGRSLDRMREALVEQGYLPEGSNINDLLNRLDSASRGVVHRSVFSEAAGEEEYQAESDRYAAMIDSMDEDDYAEFSKNRWLDDQAELLGEVSDLLDEYLDDLDNENLSAEDWQAVQVEFKEALDAEISDAGTVEKDQGTDEQTAAGAETGIPEVGKGDDAKQDQAKGAETGGGVAAVPTPAKAPGPDKIRDFGEKIGGARKDTAESGKARPAIKKSDDGQEPWRKAFVALEKVDGSGWVVGKKGDSFGLSSSRQQVFATQADAEAFIPIRAIAEKHSVYGSGTGTFAIYKKVTDRKRFKVVAQDFASREEAMKYMVEHAVDILNTKTTFGEEILPTPDRAERSGRDYRNDRPATPEMFMETFAPRGIEFGNWNNQEERQQVMNHAYDGLMDLAGVLGVPPKALMLDGELAIAFGARGQGLSGAKAHYERSYGVINLTKMSGAGSLAHEWMHAADHYFGMVDGKAKSERVKNERGDLVYPANSPSRDYLSHSTSVNSKARKELIDAYRALVETMYRKAEQYVEDTKRADEFVANSRNHLAEVLKQIRNDIAADHTSYARSKGGYRASEKGLHPASAEQLAEFDRLAGILTEGGDLETKYRYNNEARPEEGKRPNGMRRAAFGRLMAGRWTNDTLELISGIYKAVRGRSGFSKENGGPLDRARAAMKTYAERLKMLADAREGTEKSKKVATDYAIEAKKMDQARTGDYWGEPHEMIARAFASYVEDKIAEQRGKSEFLVYHAHGGILLPMIDGFIARPYPEGKERQAINAAFDTFFQTLETKSTDKGVALFALAPGKNRDTIDGKDRISLIKEGYYVPERLPQDYHRAENEGALGTAAGIAGRVQEAVRGGEISGSDAWERSQQYRQLAESSIRPAEATALKEWAEANGKLIAPAEFDKAHKERGGKGGQEHLVYFSADGTRVFKANNLSFHETYLDFFRRLAVHNTEFPDTAYTLEGFTERNGLLQPVVSQPWIKGRKATFPESHQHMLDQGYEPIGTSDKPVAYRIPGTGLIIRDVHGDNSRVSASGNVYVLDPVIEFDLDTKGDRLKAEAGIDELPEPAKGEPVEFGDELDDALADWDKDPNFALTSKSTGVAADTAQVWVSTLPIAGRVNVVQSVDDLPANARNEITKARVNPAWVQAMELHGTIHVIADNVPDMQRIKALVIGHELAHAGQEKKITDLAVDWFRRTSASTNPQTVKVHQLLRAIAGNYNLDLADEQQYRKAVKETTAAIAEKVVDGDKRFGGLLQRLLLYLKHWLRQHGLLTSVSDKELFHAVAEMLRLGEKRLSTGPSDGQFALANKTGAFDGNDSQVSFALADHDVVKRAKNAFNESTTDEMTGAIGQLLNPFDWSRLRTGFERITPDAIKDALGWFFANPVYQAERDENKRPFVDTGIEREENKIGFMLRFMGWDGQLKETTFLGRLKDTYTRWGNPDKATAWGKIQDANNKLSRADQNAVNVMLVEGDRRSRVYSSWEKALLNPTIKAANPSEAAFAVYKSVRHHIDTVVADEREKILIEMFGQAGMDKAEIGEHIADYRKILAERPGWLPRNHGEGKHQVNVYHIVNDLKFDVKQVTTKAHGNNSSQAFLPYYAGPQVTMRLTDIVKRINDERYGNGEAEREKRLKFGAFINGKALTANGQLIVTGAKEDVAAFLEEATRVVPAVIEANKQKLLDLQAERDKRSVEGASQAELKELDRAIDAATDTRIRVKNYMRLHESQGAADKQLKKVRNDLAAAMPTNYRQGETYESEYRVADSVSESTYGDLQGDFAMEQAQLQAIKRAAQKGDISDEEAKKLRDNIIKSSAEVLLGRANGRHQIERAPYMIEGYDTESAIGLYHDYMTATAGQISKAVYAREQFENFRYAPAEVKRWSETYIKDSLRNMGLADRISGNARAVASFWYLGFKASSILINATQVWTLGVAELGRRTKQNAIKTIAAAQADIMKGNLSLDEKDLFRSKIWKLQEMETTVHEISGAEEGVTGKASDIFHQLTNKAMMPFQEMELLNRRTMILAAYRAGQADGMGKHDAIKFALDVNRKTNFEMARANLPGWARNPLGRTAYALQSFVWNNWNWVYNRATSGEKADMLALLKYGAMVSALGGVSALAGGDEIDKILRRLIGKSYKMELKQWTRKHAKEYGTAGELLHAVVWHGGAGAMGINVSNSMRLNIPLSGVVTGDSSVNEAAMGVFSGLLKKPGMAMGAAQKGDYLRALENLMPEFAANPMRALRQYDQGATTMSGKPIFDETGKQVKYGAGDVAKKMLGFNPLEVSERTELKGHERELQSYWKENRNDIIANIRRAKPGPDMVQAVRSVYAFNKSLRESQAHGLVEPITASTIEKSRSFKPQKKTLAWERNQLD